MGTYWFRARYSASGDGRPNRPADQFVHHVAQAGPVMRDVQKAIIVTKGPDHATGLEELNRFLSSGWRVVTMAPMGGAVPDLLAAIVVLERRQEGVGVAAALEEAEEVSEGDGAGTVPEEIELPDVPPFRKQRSGEHDD